VEFEIAAVTVPVWLLLAWGGLVGLVFSTVGAAGGIRPGGGGVAGVVDQHLDRGVGGAGALEHVLAYPDELLQPDGCLAKTE